MNLSDLQVVPRAHILFIYADEPQGTIEWVAASDWSITLTETTSTPVTASPDWISLHPSPGTKLNTKIRSGARLYEWLYDGQDPV